MISADQIIAANAANAAWDGARATWVGAAVNVFVVLVAVGTTFAQALLQRKVDAQDKSNVALITLQTAVTALRSIAYDNIVFEEIADQQNIVAYKLDFLLRIAAPRSEVARALESDYLYFGWHRNLAEFLEFTRPLEDALRAVHGYQINKSNVEAVRSAYSDAEDVRLRLLARLCAFGRNAIVTSAGKSWVRSSRKRMFDKGYAARLPNFFNDDFSVRLDHGHEPGDKP